MYIFFIFYLKSLKKKVNFVKKKEKLMINFDSSINCHLKTKKTRE